MPLWDGEQVDSTCRRSVVEDDHFGVLSSNTRSESKAELVRVTIRESADERRGRCAAPRARPGTLLTDSSLRKRYTCPFSRLFQRAAPLRGVHFQLQLVMLRENRLEQATMTTSRREESGGQRARSSSLTRAKPALLIPGIGAGPDAGVLIKTRSLSGSSPPHRCSRLLNGRSCCTETASHG